MRLCAMTSSCIYNFLVKVTKWCDVNGSWFKHPSSKSEWKNYTACFHREVSYLCASNHIAYGKLEAHKKIKLITPHIVCYFVPPHIALVFLKHKDKNDTNERLCVLRYCYSIMRSSNGIIFRVTGPLCGEFTRHRYFPSKVQRRGALKFSLVWVWINGWV